MVRPGRRWLWWAVALSGVVVAACGSDDKPTSGVTIETLAAATGTACPVAFEVSADNSGIDTPSPATGSVVVGHPDITAAAGSSPSLSPIDAADGVIVTCSLQLAGGPLELMLVAARTDAATELLLPEAARVGQLSTNQTTQLANDVARTGAGELVPVPGSEAVAMMPTKVKGASSAALLVWADGLKRAQVEQVARQLDERLR